MNVAIIQYNGGNTQSVAFALERIGVTATLTADPEAIKAADKVIFPGVGAAGAAMQYLREKELDSLIPQLTQPVLGICLGMQLMCRFSEEGNTPCLGIFDEQVLRFGQEEKVPHMGWNTIDQLQSPLFKNVAEYSYAYFVHSYYVPVVPQSIGITSYPQPFSAAMQQDNFYAVQFHPEKSGPGGEQILQNFLAL
jgi:glutamine amidotransferase